MGVAKEAKDKKINQEYMEMVSKSVNKTYTDEDRKKLGIAPTPKTEVFRQATWTLYRYDLKEKSKFPPLLIIPSLINRYYIMDLLKDHSIIESLVGAGLDVFLLDWGHPEAAYGHIGIGHYVSKFLKRAVRQIKKITASAKINLMGQCLGGTLCALYAAHPEFKKDINKLALLTTPLNFENSGLLSKWTNSDGFDIEKLTASVGPVVPADFFHASFPFLNVRQSLAKYKNLLERFETADFKKIWQALDFWANDNVAFTLNAFRDLIKVFYQQNRFYKDGFLLGEHLVRSADIDLPTLAVAAKEDHVFTETAAEAILESKAAKEKNVKYHVMAAGHVTLIAALPIRHETFKIFSDFFTAKK